MGKKEKISVFNYLNYREYLKDLYNFFKEKDGLSLRQFARKADFSSHAYLKNIIDGYREATVNSALKLAKGFNLSDKEASYLELLIRFNRATSIEEKNIFYKKLSKIKEQHLTSCENALNESNQVNRYLESRVQELTIMLHKAERLME